MRTFAAIGDWVDDLDASVRERLGFTGRVPVLTTVWRLLVRVDADSCDDLPPHELGVDHRRVVADPHGLGAYDSCLRAREVYGIERALIVTQSDHLSRAVTLCRALGIDADGVPVRCAGCGSALLREKAIRDYLASGKASWDMISRRPPAVDSPAHPGVTDALTD
ncbi:ElyC/SanA/YdcF family protein [Micromonospora sonchi]|uniref:ElyC/SanA/YdcF family protein n=1 Tax=Micromonospora sonchi TaxID=1763543 RepID=UPI001E55D93D|nr:ElyC/SanA/YdcF family protein [Micromonospora sonchi]